MNHKKLDRMNTIFRIKILFIILSLESIRLIEILFEKDCLKKFEEMQMKTLTPPLSRFCLCLFLSIMSFFPVTTIVFGKFIDKGLVVTPDSIATLIAMDILDQGGNAVDAGVAAMFALSVVQPYASGLGGGGFMLIRMHQEGKIIVIDFREQAPQGIDPFIFYQDNEIFNIYTKYGSRSICIPGMVAGAEKSLTAYGTMTFKQVLQPAIDLAAEGFVVSEALANIITENYDLLESNRATSFIFLPDWFPLRAGEIQKRQDLAFTFNLLVLHGVKSFYQGDIATDIYDELRMNNGLIQLTDLQTYQPIIRNAIHGKYRNLDVFSVPLPSCGGLALIELLKILERFKLNEYSINSGPYIHFVAEATKQVFQDREEYYLADPKFDSDNIQFVLSDNHIEKCYCKIDSNDVNPIINKSMNRHNNESRNATHISIIDQDGNVVSISHTLNNFFGSGITIPKYGILLNNAMNNFSNITGRNNSLEPGKRPQTTLAPTILLKNQQPYLILGGNGAEQIISMLAQIIINIVDFNLSLDQAVLSPRFHYNYYDDAIEMETRIEANSIDYLKRLGHKVNLRQDFDVYFGSAQAILIDPNNHVYSAINDMRQEGVVYVK